jgi:hypothetical protein
VSARKNPVVVDDTPGTPAEVSTLEVDEVGVAETVVDAQQAPAQDDTADEVPDASPAGRRVNGRVVVGAVAALVVATGAIWAAGSLGDAEPQELSLSISDPAVVVSALDQGGISCSGSVVSGDVATCNATVAVRVFDSEDAADSWVTDLLRDPMTSSAFGWVQHGNVVVSAPLNAAPDVAAALGPDASVH